jgi:sedoheptulokinase
LLLDLENPGIVEHRSAPNRRLPSDDPLAYFQDPPGIVRAVLEMLGSVSRPMASIGVTGQVHGILYTGTGGEACSPLYTWLDRHGTEAWEGSSIQDYLAEKTGRRLPVGYGLLTHFANRLCKRVPGDARRIAGINEFVAGALCGFPLEMADSSDLACFGAWDPVTEQGDPQVLETIFGGPGENPLIFPRLAEPFSLAGVFRGPGGREIPVACPVGDNQAGFFGLVSRPADTSLISIGTSGQISVYSRSADCPAGMELRPYLGRGYLHVGATLCAGKAYEVLARLFAELIGLYKGNGPEAAPVPGEEIFSLMKKAALERAGDSNSLIIDTAFNGSRSDPARRGSVANIGMDNFTVGNLVQGTVEGVVRELAEFRQELGAVFAPVKSLVVSGSAVRKNELFRTALDRQFALPVRIPPFNGGAAVGAALIGAQAAGILRPEHVEPYIDALWEGNLKVRAG